MSDHQIFSWPEYKQMLVQIDERIRSTSLHELEDIAIRLISFQTQGGIPNTSLLNSFAGLSLDRLVCELLAFAGSLRAGSHIGIAHHTRAIVENHANAAYITCPIERFPEDKRSFNSTELRLQRFFRFREVSQFKHFKKIVRLAEEGMTEDQCQARYACSIDNARRWVNSVTDARKQAWLDLYRPSNGKINRIGFWHSPHTVRDILDWCIASEITSLHEIYGLTSSITHPNVLFGGFLGKPYWAAGFPDSARELVENQIQLASVLARDTISMAERVSQVETGIFSRSKRT